MHPTTPKELSRTRNFKGLHRQSALTVAFGTKGLFAEVSKRPRKTFGENHPQT
jgi:hypothetical protein